MQTALDTFHANMERVRTLHGLYVALAKQTTPAMDLSDILRAEVVLAVSVFDFFVHELTRLGMLACHAGDRPTTDAYNRFGVPLQIAATLSAATLDVEIRNRHSYQSFQQPDKIADAVRLFSSVELWRNVATECGVEAKTLKADLTLLIDRRNKIAHEADMDPSFPNQRWPIDVAQTEYTFDLLEKVARAIFVVVK